MNKFSSDLNELESNLQYYMGSILALTSGLAYVMIVAIIALPWIGLLFPFVFLISYWILMRALPAIRETVRLEATIKSPLLSHLTETISGASTIRAF